MQKDDEEKIYLHSYIGILGISEPTTKEIGRDSLFLNNSIISLQEYIRKNKLGIVKCPGSWTMLLQQLPWAGLDK